MDENEAENTKTILDCISVSKSRQYAILKWEESKKKRVTILTSQNNH